MSVSGFHKMSMKELADIQDKSSGVEITPAYHKRIFREGYDAFFDELLIADCLYSTEAPGYRIWVSGWVQGFKQYVKASEDQRNGEN